MDRAPGQWHVARLLDPSTRAHGPAWRRPCSVKSIDTIAYAPSGLAAKLLVVALSLAVGPESDKLSLLQLQRRNRSIRMAAVWTHNSYLTFSYVVGSPVAEAYWREELPDVELGSSAASPARADLSPGETCSARILTRLSAACLASSSMEIPSVGRRELDRRPAVWLLRPTKREGELGVYQSYIMSIHKQRVPSGVGRAGVRPDPGTQHPARQRQRLGEGCRCPVSPWLLPSASPASCSLHPADREPRGGKRHRLIPQIPHSPRSPPCAAG